MFFYCETCKTAICRDCTVIEHDKTAGHSIVRMKDAISTKRHKSEDQLRESRNVRYHIQRASRQMDSFVEKQQVEKNSAIENLKSMMKYAHQQLELCEQQSTEAILQHYEAQQGTLLDVQHELYQTIRLLEKRINQSEELVNAGDITDITDSHDKLKTATGNAKSDFKMLESEKKGLASDTVIGRGSLNDKVCSLGRKCFKTFLPAKFVLKNDNLPARPKSTFTLELISDDGNKSLVTACFLTVVITDPWKCTLPVSLDTTHSECIVTFMPQRSGRHEVVVMYLGEKLKSEKNHVSVKGNDPVLKFGGKGNGNGRFNSPRGIAIDNKNCLYVADTGNGLIQKFSADGYFLRQFRVHKNTENYSTFDLAFDVNKQLLICTELSMRNGCAVGGNTMLSFDLVGKLQNSYTLNSMTCAVSRAVNIHGNALISDILEKCVYEVDREGNILERIGDFKYPGYICITDDGTIIVSDSHDDQIYMFNPDRSIKRQFGSTGQGKGQLKTPFGVGTDGENILVADENNRVQVFQCDGTPVCLIESKGDPLNKPRGLAVSDDGYVYVVDRDNHCVKKYKYRDMSW